MRIFNSHWEWKISHHIIIFFDGKDYRIKDLFDPSSKLLQQLFYGDVGIFPDKQFVSENNFEPVLNKLGIILPQVYKPIYRTVQNYYYRVHKIRVELQSLLSF
jgi:hypothetical protein